MAPYPIDVMLWTDKKKHSENGQCSVLALWPYASIPLMSKKSSAANTKFRKKKEMKKKRSCLEAEVDAREDMNARMSAKTASLFV